MQLATLLISFAALLAPFADAQLTPMMFRAQHATREGAVIRLHAVRVDVGTATIQAEEAVFDESSRELRARGNVRVTLGTSPVMVQARQIIDTSDGTQLQGLQIETGALMIQAERGVYHQSTRELFPQGEITVAFRRARALLEKQPQGRLHTL